MNKMKSKFKIWLVGHSFTPIDSYFKLNLLTKRGLSFGPKSKMTHPSRGCVGHITTETFLLSGGLHTGMAGQWRVWMRVSLSWCKGSCCVRRSALLYGFIKVFFFTIYLHQPSPPQRGKTKSITIITKNKLVSKVLHDVQLIHHDVEEGEGGRVVKGGGQAPLLLVTAAHCIEEKIDNASL